MRKIAFFTRSFREHRYGFTLVELIVVITILAILATIAFLSFQNYSSQARDTVRTSDLTNIQKGLELYLVKSRTYPAPNNPISYTGGANSTTIMSQGTIPGNMISISKTTPSDPLTNIAYTYSTSGDGRYYQIEAELENSLASNNYTNTTYAASPKLAVLKGNYTFDPSLPSLVISKESADKIKANTLSGIFDPNVCFVLDGKTNLVDTTTGCISKKAMSLKDLDSGLVGYWDMETTSGGLLSDLSGNGNNGTFSGGMVYNNALTGGVLGKGLNFNGTSDFIEVLNSTSLNINGTGSKISIVVNADILTNPVWDTMVFKGSLNILPGYINRQYGLWVYRQTNILYGASTRINGTGMSSISSKQNSIINNKGNYIYIIDSDIGKTFLYMNGTKIREGIYSKSGIISSTGSLFFGNGESPSMYGILDDIKIYNRALSDQEILQQAKLAGF